MKGVQIVGCHIARGDNIFPCGRKTDSRKLFYIVFRIFRGVIREIHKLSALFQLFAEVYRAFKRRGIKVDRAVHI